MFADIQPILASEDLNTTTERARSTISAHSVVLVRRFPVDAADFIQFVSSWGEPLTYYGQGTGGAHAEHPAIHRVRYDREAALRGELHGLDGPLSLHSAQSLREPRPGYFAMLMVDPGWRDGPPGTNGESILVEWRVVFEALARREPARWRAIVAPLMNPVPLPGGVEGAIVYALPDARGPYDLGVRFKYGLAEFWDDAKVDRAVREGLAALIDVAKDHVVETQLDAGDFLIVDNNRWAHGRRAVRGQNGTAVNPRELWSVTIASVAGVDPRGATV